MAMRRLGVLSKSYLKLGDSIYPDIDDCSRAPCQNAGTCVDGVDSFNCICVAGFTGEICQTGECFVYLLEQFNLQVLYILF